MENPPIYEEMAAEGLYPAWPELSALTGSEEDKAAAKLITDEVWAAATKGVADGD